MVAKLDIVRSECRPLHARSLHVKLIGCQVKGWCQVVHNGTIKKEPVEGGDAWSVFVRCAMLERSVNIKTMNSVLCRMNYEFHGYKMDSSAGGLQRGLNLWTMKEILEAAGTSFAKVLPHACNAQVQCNRMHVMRKCNVPLMRANMVHTEYGNRYSRVVP